jgi:hypothetical protein
MAQKGAFACTLDSAYQVLQRGDESPVLGWVVVTLFGRLAQVQAHHLLRFISSLSILHSLCSPGTIHPAVARLALF